MDERLSVHFSLDELTRSQTASRLGINNQPTPEVVAMLRRLAITLLEPIRDLLGAPLHVDSGYRSPALNGAVGGAASSAHLDGRAADLVPIGVGLVAAFDFIRRSSLPFDQVILECGAWIHVAVARPGDAPRRQALEASGRPGHWIYLPVS